MSNKERLAAGALVLASVLLVGLSIFGCVALAKRGRDRFVAYRAAHFQRVCVETKPACKPNCFGPFDLAQGTTAIHVDFACSGQVCEMQCVRTGWMFAR